VQLRGGMWDGQSVSLIGGGPSLRWFEFSRIPEHHKIIVLNAAFKFIPDADLFFTEDSRFIQHFGEQLHQNFTGIKVWHCLKGAKKNDGLLACPSLTVIEEDRDDKFWASNLSSLSFSSNSAVGAINLAELLGAKRLYLLGIDCRAEGSVMTNFHDCYPQGWEVGGIQEYNWRQDFEAWVKPNCKIPEIINVVNPEFESTITCWPKMTLSEYVA